MVESTYDWLVTLAGALHFAQLPSMRIASRRLGWDAQLRQLGAFGRQLAVLFGGGIMVCVLGLGLVVVSSHAHLLREFSGRCLCVFLAFFWLKRGAIQWLFFGASWPESLRWMHRALSVLYPAMGSLYALGAVSVWL